MLPLLSGLRRISAGVGREAVRPGPPGAVRIVLQELLCSGLCTRLSGRLISICSPPKQWGDRCIGLLTFSGGNSLLSRHMCPRYWRCLDGPGYPAPTCAVLPLKGNEGDGLRTEGS